MPIPSYDEFVWPLMQVLGDQPDGLRSTDVYAAIAKRVGLSSAEQDELLPSGHQPVYQNRIGWAHDRLKRAGYSYAVLRGVWALTDAGKAFLQAHPRGLSEEEIERIVKVPADSSVRDLEVASPDLELQPPGKQSPQERIDVAVSEIHESLSAELLDLIGQASPTFFEQLVLDLLVAMGYGASRASLQRTGRSGDGGIDGIISLDRLGLEKVYVQRNAGRARSAAPSSRPFFGALAGKRANKGVFITTSSFSRDSREYAKQVSDSLVLIDGALLSSLMREYRVGVSLERTIAIARPDVDYFEEA